MAIDRIRARMLSPQLIIKTPKFERVAAATDMVSSGRFNSLKSHIPIYGVRSSQPRWQNMASCITSHRAPSILKFDSKTKQEPMSTKVTTRIVKIKDFDISEIDIEDPAHKLTLFKQLNPDLTFSNNTQLDSVARESGTATTTSRVRQKLLANLKTSKEIERVRTSLDTLNISMR